MRSKFLPTLLMVLLLTSCNLSLSIYVGCDPGELINAINTANSDPNHTIINLDAGCIYNLTAVDNYIDSQEGFSGDSGATGLPPVTTQITIKGNNATIQRSATASPPDFRIFFVTQNGDLTLNDLSIFNGSVQGSVINDGGGIYLNKGVLALNRSYLMDNIAEDAGGGIVNVEGTVNIHNSSVSSNQAKDGGAIFNHSNSTILIDENSMINNNSVSFSGGAIANQGEMTILSSNVEQNQAGLHGGGVCNLGNLLIVNSTITGNDAQTEGGGIHNQGELTIQDSLISTNSSGLSGGGLYTSDGRLTITGSTVLENQSSGDGGGLSAALSTVLVDGGSTFSWNYAQNDGGGIFNSQDSRLVLEGSIIYSNSADGSGGGVSNSSTGEMTISTSTIKANGGVNGGGVNNQADLLITQSTISENTAVTGGGIKNGGLLTIINSTISANTADVTGGIHSAMSGILNIVHCTIVENTSSPGIGSGVHSEYMLNIRNSIVANNYHDNCDAAATINAVGENLDSDGACVGFTITADPLIDRLDDNGGHTFTHALFASSPAINAAEDCADLDGNPITVDQRGSTRLPGPSCDLGAYEDSTILIPPPPPMITLTPTQLVYSCEGFLDVTIRDDGTMRIQLSTPGLLAGSYHATAGGTDFACQTYYDEYPDRLFCDGPAGEGGTLTTLAIFDHSENLFCEEQFSIPETDMAVPQGEQEIKGCWWGPINSPQSCVYPCPNDAYSGGPCDP